MLHCYVCNVRFPPRTMRRIDREEDGVKRQIAIQRRNDFDREPVEVTDLTRLCINCDQSINNEIIEVQQNPNCLRINVLTQTRNSTCFICNATVNIHRLSVECIARIFIKRNTYVPEDFRSCAHHLNEKCFLLPPLYLGVRFINRPYVLNGQQL